MFSKVPGHTLGVVSFAPPSANLSQVQTLFQNCLHSAFWYARTTSYIFDRRSKILFVHNLYSSDVSFGNRGFRPFRTGIIFNRKFPSFKSFNSPKNCAHLNGLRSIYTTQFIKYLLWIYIKPNASFNIVRISVFRSMFQCNKYIGQYIWLHLFQFEISNLHEKNGYR